MSYVGNSGAGLKFLFAAVGTLIVGAALVGLGVLVVYLIRISEPGPFDLATAIVFVLYVLNPMFVFVGGGLLFVAVVLLVGAAISAAVRRCS